MSKAALWSPLIAMVVLYTQSLSAQVQYVNGVPISASASPVAPPSAAFAPLPTGGLLLFGGARAVQELVRVERPGGMPRIERIRQFAPAAVPMR